MCIDKWTFTCHNVVLIGKTSSSVYEKATSLSEAPLAAVNLNINTHNMPHINTQGHTNHMSAQATSDRALRRAAGR